MNTEIQFEDVKQAVFTIWKRKMLVMAVTVLGMLVGLLVVSVLPVKTVYQAQASVYSASYGSSQQEQVIDGVTAMNDYSGVINSNKVCERAAANIGEANVTARKIQNMIGTSFNSTSYIMYVSAHAENPELAVKAANAVADAFVEEINDITGYKAVQVLDEAQTVFSYDSTSRKKLFAFIVVVSFGCICAYIGLQELFSDKVKSIEQCIDVDENEIIGIIPYIE